jgi:hypothetical protein
MLWIHSSRRNGSYVSTLCIHILATKSEIMPSYTAYSLGIHSALVLPELPPSDAAADVVIRFGSVDRALPDASKQGLIDATAEEAYLFFEGIAKFLIRAGREITIDPVPGADEAWMRVGVLGPSMGALLYQRGLLTLHASSVSVGGEAVAFVGERGWGKSTMAAVMCARGHRLVADDVTAVQIDGANSPTVHPGYPQLKLWPEAAASLGEDPEALPRLDPITERRARRLTSEFSADPLPLRRVYVLSGGEDIEVKPVGTQEALIELIRHTYSRELFQAVDTRAHFLKCSAVVNRVPICSLNRQYSLSALPDLALLVEEDLARSDKSDLVNAG